MEIIQDGKVQRDLSEKHIVVIGCVGTEKQTIINMLKEQFNAKEEKIYIALNDEEIKELPKGVIILSMLEHERPIPRIGDLDIQKARLVNHSHEGKDNSFKTKYLCGNSYHKEWRR